MKALHFMSRRIFTKSVQSEFSTFLSSNLVAPLYYFFLSYDDRGRNTNTQNIGITMACPLYWTNKLYRFG